MLQSYIILKPNADLEALLNIKKEKEIINNPCIQLQQHTDTRTRYKPVNISVIARFKTSRL